MEAAATALSTLLLLTAVWRGGTICTASSYTAYPGMSVNGGPISTSADANAVTACLLQCNTLDNCYGYIFDATRPNGNKCRHVFFYFEFPSIYATGNQQETLYWRNCGISTRPPPLSTTTTTRPPPTRPPPTPSATPCPDADGLSTGIVVLIAVFTAIGGMILGMLLATKCCPLGNGWLNGGAPCPNCRVPGCTTCKTKGGCTGCNCCNKPSEGPGCVAGCNGCESCSGCKTKKGCPPGCTGCPSCKSCPSCRVPGCNSCSKAGGCKGCNCCSTPCAGLGCGPGCTGCKSCKGSCCDTGPQMMHHKPAAVFPALLPPTNAYAGQTFSVAASPYNDVYTVSLSGN